MKAENLIKALFPHPQAVDLRGLPLGSTQEDVQKQEGEPYDKTSMPGRETWLYSFKLEEKVLTEPSFVFGKKPILVSSEVYLTFYAGSFSGKQIEKIRDAFVEFLSARLGPPEKKVVKLKIGFEYFYTWQKEEGKKKQQIIMTDFDHAEDAESSAEHRVITFSQT